MVVRSRILVLLLVVIGMTACSGGDTGIGVILEPEIEVIPEPVEEVIPEPTPEPIVETIYVPTLESWGIENGELEIVDGNCNLPILKKVDFPNDVSANTYKIKSKSGAIMGGGPECEDSDPEASVVEIEGCIDTYWLGITIRTCEEGYWHRCHEDGDFDVCEKVDYEIGIKPGYTNFYDDVFRQSTSYIDTRGEAEDHPETRSFIMVQTRNGGSLASPSGDYRAGKLYGKYNPSRGEYEDRKALWDACEVGTDPEKGTYVGDKRNGINGDWQMRKVNGDVEVCIRLDTTPGAVKCFVDDPDNERVELYTMERDNSEMVDTSDRYLAVPGTIFGNFEVNKLCELFDEG